MTIRVRARRLWPGRMPFDPCPRNRIAKNDVLDAMAAAHTASCFLQGLDSHLSSLGKNCFRVDSFDSRPGRFTGSVGDPGDHGGAPPAKLPKIGMFIGCGSS